MTNFISSQKQFTSEERIRRVWDKEEAKAVLCRHIYCESANQRARSLEQNWVREPEHQATASYGKNWGYYVGMDAIRGYYVDNNPFGAPGTNICHPVATICVEEAEDGQTCQAMWYNASYETRMADGSYVEYNYDTTPPSAISLKCNQEPFSDIRVRKALQMAINMEEIHAGYYGLTNELVIPGVWATNISSFTSVNNWSNALKAEYTYNPEGAKALLAEAGYPDGFTFTVSLAPNADTDLFVLVKTYFAAIGVTMEIQSCVEIMETISISSNPDDPRQVSGTHGGKGAFPIIKMTTTSAGANYTYQHNNEAYETAVANYERAVTLKDQAEFAREMDQIFSEEHWSIALGGYNQLNEFMASRVHGYDGQRLTLNQYRRTVVARLWVDA